MDEGITAVVPAYNEADSIQDTIQSLQSIEGINEIIAVDDGSNDDTLNVLKSIENIKVIHHPKNQGKGYAIKAALPDVTNKYVLLVDADLGKSAVEMHKLINHTKLGSKSMLVAVYPAAQRKGGFGMVKKLSKKSIYYLTSKESESVLSGQRLMHTDFLKSIELPNNFGLEFKITLEALKKQMSIVDIPLNIRHRETGRDIKGFIHRGKQFANILSVVIKELIQ